MADRSYSSPPAAGEEAADAEAFAQLAALPAAALVAETAASLANLAAMRLAGGPDGDGPPDLDGARLLIDAFAGVLEASGARLGAAEPQLRQALAQLRMAYVNARDNAPQAAPDASPDAGSQGTGAPPPPSPSEPAEQDPSDLSRPRSGLWVPGQPL